uniref:DDI1 homolog 2 n=1 Tax=Caligus rogercresseyi TaxID=217165 RepID=C1BPN0_CALRO|nr:DDI1 homolog 2 [Caligus rogercresseyi]
MKVSVTYLSADKFYSLEVSSDLAIENFKALCEVESGVEYPHISLSFNGVTLDDEKKSLEDYGVHDGDMILLEKKRTTSSRIPSMDFSQIRLPGQSGSSASSTIASTSSGAPGTSSSSNSRDPAWIRSVLKASPEQMAILKQNNPRLADAVTSGSLEEFAAILKEQQKARIDREKQRMRLLTADPFDAEAQRLIAKEIEAKNIEQNMELAMEYSPESFGTVVMLYIDCKVNGHQVKAFVDSGAQTTIMSQAAAERCNVMRLLDRRWEGIAKGVGIQKILGRIHMVQIQIKDQFLTSSFAILENQPMDILLGLDMLKRHQCSIDLKKNVLVIGSTRTETPFLNESELPDFARLSANQGGSEDKQVQEALKRSVEEDNKRQKTDDLKPEDKFTEEDIQTLIGYGFPRDKAIEAMRKSKGDLTQATAALFAGSLKFQ